MIQIQLQKTKIRKKLRQIRRGFELKNLANQNIMQNLHAFICKQSQPIAHIGLYYPMASEASLLDFAQQYSSQFSFYLPKITQQNMDFVYWDQQSTLIPDSMGILSPASMLSFIPTIICVPLLGFTLQKHRIGQGAGFYDRFISQVKKQNQHPPIYLGVAFECQKVNDLPIETHDQKLDYIITEKQIY